MYNIGVQKLIIQLLIGEGKNLVYYLPQTETFKGFVEFNSFEDLGFVPTGLRINCCSRFAFLSLDEDTQKIFVNILLADPYYETPQILLFQSSNFFYERKGA